jgi:hypothetical protein
MGKPLELPLPFLVTTGGHNAGIVKDPRRTDVAPLGNRACGLRVLARAPGTYVLQR